MCEPVTQIQSTIVALGDYMNIQHHVCIGGTSIDKDMHTLKYGQYIISGMPRRSCDMIHQHTLCVCNSKMLIPDESNTLLNNSVKDQIYNIYHYLPPAMQVVLLGATLPCNVQELASSPTIGKEQFYLLLSSSPSHCDTCFPCTPCQIHDMCTSKFGH